VVEDRLIEGLRLGGGWEVIELHDQQQAPRR
jgi:hypothetical protein